MGYKSKFEPAPFGTGATSSIHGDLEVNGEIYANSYHIDVVTKTITNIEHDGSTKFGDTPDDTHIFTGSMWISGNIGSHRPWLGNDSGSTGLGLGGVAVQFTTPFIFYVDPAGSDYNDGKTLATPLKTIKKALELSPWNAEHNYGYAEDTPGFGGATQINLAPGIFNWPTSIYGANNMRIMGSTSSFDSIISDWVVVSSSRPDGSIVDAAFSNTYDEDELRGTLIQLSSSLVNNHTPSGFIYANEATDGGNTRIYFTCTTGPENLPADSSSLNLIRLDSKMETDQYVVELRIRDSAGLALENLHFRTPEFSSLSVITPFNEAFLSWANSNGSARNCKFGNDPTVDYNAFSSVRVNRGAVVGFNNCYFRMKARDIGTGHTGDRCVNVSGGGLLYLNSGNTLVGTRIGLWTQGAPQVRLNGEVVFRDVYDSDWDNTGPYGCIDHRGPAIVNSNAGGVLRFFEFTGSTTCDEAIRSNMAQNWLVEGAMTIPEMYGSVNSDYGIITRRACNVAVHPSSSLSSSLGINKFSADGGQTICAQAGDMTVITGTFGKPIGDFPFLESTGFVQYATGSTILGNLSSDIHQVTGSWHMSGTSASFNVDEFRVDMFSPDNPTWGTYPGMVIDLKARPDHGHSPRIIFGGEPEDLPFTSYGAVTIMEKMTLAQDGSPYAGLQIMFSGTYAEQSEKLHASIIHFASPQGTQGSHLISLEGYYSPLADSCSWAPDVKHSSIRLQAKNIGDIHFGGNHGWGAPNVNPLHGTSSMILHTIQDGGGSLFLGRPWDGSRAASIGLGSGSLFVSGSTKFGTKTTDTHQVTGALSLSGSGAGSFGGEGGQLSLFGANTSIVGRHADGIGLGSLHVYCDHKLYLGSRGVDQIGIGRPNPDADFATNTPIFIHTANRTIAISGAMAYKSRESFTTFGTASTYAQIIGVDSSGLTPFEIELPTAATIAGQVLIVKDEGGNCTAANVIINGSGSETIDGNPTVLLDNNYESVNLYSNGTNWFIW